VAIIHRQVAAKIRSEIDSLRLGGVYLADQILTTQVLT